MKPSDNRYWFPARKYGWGWGLPRRWQGWVVLAVYLALLGAGMVIFKLPAEMLMFIVYVLFLSAMLIAICRVKGEKPRWRWGD